MKKPVDSGVALMSSLALTDAFCVKSQRGTTLGELWRGHDPLRQGLTPSPLACLPAHHFIAATACQEADYGWMIRHYCLKQFQLSMEGIGQRLWCDWDETVG